MGKTYAIQYQPLPLRYWIHEHQWLVGSSLGLIVVILAAALATVSVSMVRDAIAEQIQPFAQGAEVVSTATLPREWSRSPRPITFDHMYRQSDAPPVVEYTRDVRHKYSSSSSE